MSNIDYIKNINVMYANPANTNFEFSFNASNFPTNEPFHEVKVRQILYSTDTDESGQLFLIWSDLNNDYIGSLLVRDIMAQSNADTTITLNKPINGEIRFQLHRYFNDGSHSIANIKSQIIINLDFIRYKK